MKTYTLASQGRRDLTPQTSGSPGSTPILSRLCQPWAAAHKPGPVPRLGEGTPPSDWNNNHKQTAKGSWNRLHLVTSLPVDSSPKEAGAFQQVFNHVKERMEAVASTYIHFHVLVRSCYITQGAQPGSVIIQRGGRQRGEGGLRGDICIITADLHCRTAETITTLQSNFPLIKK